jgi:hypothetical protein
MALSYLFMLESGPLHHEDVLSDLRRRIKNTCGRIIIERLFVQDYPLE